MRILNATPVCVVDRIEPAVDFWERTLGFAREAEVPHGDVLGFVLLKKDEREIMFQTRESIVADLPAISIYLSGPNPVVQFIEVDTLDEILSTFSEKDFIVPLRTTFYGMKEVGLLDPSGFVLIFAQKVA